GATTAPKNGSPIPKEKWTPALARRGVASSARARIPAARVRFVMAGQNTWRRRMLRAAESCNHGGIRRIPRARGSPPRAALEDRPVQDDLGDLPEVVDARRGIAGDEHEVGPLPHRRLAEVGALTREEARVLPRRRAQRLARREARLDHLRELEVEPRAGE